MTTSPVVSGWTSGLIAATLSGAEPSPVASDPGLMPGLQESATQPVGQPVTPEGRSTEFVAVQGGNDGTSAEALLVAAYALMWVLLLGFVILTWRRQLGIEGRLNTLERALGHRERSESTRS